MRERYLRPHRQARNAHATSQYPAPAMTTFDPFEPGQAADAWDTLRELRRSGAVAPIAGGMHYVTRHPECIALLRDTDSFSNATGFKAPGTVIPLEDRILGELDPPRHGVVRRAMVTALT